MKKLNLFLSGLLLVMIISTGIGTAMAYFTDTTSAAGGRTVSVEYHATPDETIENNLKAITITADENSGLIYVRAKVYSVHDITYTSRTDKRWAQVADKDTRELWWVYKEPLEAGQSTGPLIAEIHFPEGEEGDSTNVIVITEYTPAQYDDDGNLLPYDQVDFNLPVEGGEN